jgi:hypothetical protein
MSALPRCIAAGCSGHSKRQEEKYCSQHLFQYRLDIALCAICMEKVSVFIDIPLACGHVFHSECMQEWSREKHSCPSCRRAFNEEELVTFSCKKVEFKGYDVKFAKDLFDDRNDEEIDRLDPSLKKMRIETVRMNAFALDLAKRFGWLL